MDVPEREQVDPPDIHVRRHYSLSSWWLERYFPAGELMIGNTTRLVNIYITAVPDASVDNTSMIFLFRVGNQQVVLLKRFPV